MGVLCSDIDCSPQMTEPLFYTANSRADRGADFIDAGPQGTRESTPILRKAAAKEGDLSEAQGVPPSSPLHRPIETPTWTAGGPKMLLTLGSQHPAPVTEVASKAVQVAETALSFTPLSLES